MGVPWNVSSWGGSAVTSMCYCCVQEIDVVEQYEYGENMSSAAVGNLHPFVKGTVIAVCAVRPCSISILLSAFCLQNVCSNQRAMWVSWFSQRTHHLLRNTEPMSAFFEYLYTHAWYRSDTCPRESLRTLDARFQFAQWNLRYGTQYRWLALYSIVFSIVGRPFTNCWLCVVPIASGGSCEKVPTNGSQVSWLAFVAKWSFHCECYIRNLWYVLGPLFKNLCVLNDCKTLGWMNNDQYAHIQWQASCDNVWSWTRILAKCSPKITAAEAVGKIWYRRKLCEQLKLTRFDYFIICTIFCL